MISRAKFFVTSRGRRRAFSIMEKRSPYSGRELARYRITFITDRNCSGPQALTALYDSR